LIKFAGFLQTHKHPSLTKNALNKSPVMRINYEPFGSLWDLGPVAFPAWGTIEAACLSPATVGRAVQLLEV